MAFLCPLCTSPDVQFRASDALCLACGNVLTGADYLKVVNGPTPGTAERDPGSVVEPISDPNGNLLA